MKFNLNFIVSQTMACHIFDLALLSVRNIFSKNSHTKCLAHLHCVKSNIVVKKIYDNYCWNGGDWILARARDIIMRKSRINTHWLLTPVLQFCRTADQSIRQCDMHNILLFRFVTNTVTLFRALSQYVNWLVIAHRIVRMVVGINGIDFGRRWVDEQKWGFEWGNETWWVCFDICIVRSTTRLVFWASTKELL